MSISTKSHIFTGLTSALGAGAVVLTAALPPATVSIAPAAFDSPLSELIATGLLINNDIFNGSEVFGDYEWEPYQGAVPEFIYTALPVLAQLGFNGSAYIGGTVDSLGTSAYILSEAVWQLPAAVATAAQQAIGGDIPGAITTLTNAIVVPVQDAASLVTSALASVVGGVVTNLSNLLTIAPGILQGLVTTAVGSAQAVVTAAVNIATQTVGALSTLDVETAWNTVVDGLLGPVGADGTVESSLPGTIEAVTLGPGLGPLGYPNGYAVPSLRMWGEQSQLQIANAIGASYPVPAAAKVSAPVRAKKAAIASRAAVAASDSEPKVKRTRR
ncbi:MAG: hypothetical protein ACR2JI_07275 [Mycobacterium sp.]